MPIEATITGQGTGVCPRCGVRFNYTQKSVGTVRRCQGCGEKLHVRTWKSCSVVFILILFVACGGLGFLGLLGSVMGNLVGNRTPRNAAATPAEETAISADTHSASDDDGSVGPGGKTQNVKGYINKSGKEVAPYQRRGR